MSLARFLSWKNLRSDRFATACMVLGVALGTATVNVVLTLNVNTRRVEAGNWSTNPDLLPDVASTVSLSPLRPVGPAVEKAKKAAPAAEDTREETHEDYQVMRSAIRLGSLSAFLVGALIVFFSFAVVIEHRRREMALLRSLGATARQAAGVLVREAVWVGAAGALLGLLGAIPLSFLAARVGITTTGRSKIDSLTFPWAQMLAVSALGGLTALLGVLPPVRKILKLRVPEALRPRFLDEAHARAIGRRTPGITLVAVPFALLAYGLMRPLFREVLPSLVFFVLEAVLVMLALLALLLLVPELTRVVGGALARAFLHGPRAAKLLTTSRIRRQGHELAWSVGGVMLVFSLLLSLHISTYALKSEVARFGEIALRGHAFLFTNDESAIPSSFVAAMPPGLSVTRYSGRTRQPNQVAALPREDLQALARAERRPELAELAAGFREDSVILSSLMARRLGLAAGDQLELSSPRGKRTLNVTAVTDALGFFPVRGTYRSSKTYAIVEAASYPLIEPFVSPIGSNLVLTDTSAARTPVNFIRLVGSLPTPPNVHASTGHVYELGRKSETNRDFLIFDLILVLTTVLAAIGVANQLILAVHTRRRELALLRVLGMTADQIRTMLLLEGAFVGLLGGTLAVLLGVPLGLASLAALKLVSAFEVHFALPFHYVLLTIVGAVAVAVLAAVYPARRAASAHSAEAVHYE